MSGGDRKVSRRRFVAAAAVGGGAALVGGGYLLKRHLWRAPPPLAPRALQADERPVRALSDLAQTGFTGDDFTRPHRFLWALEQRTEELGGVPAPTERVPLVVVGGGISGLASAWMLRQHRPIVLEQAAQLGGNSRGERWRGLAWSIGAAYISPPEPGREVDTLFGELGLRDSLRVNEGDSGGAFILNGRLNQGFWRGASDPARAAEFERVFAKLKAVYDEGNVLIPLEPGRATEVTKALDAITFTEWVRRELGEVHPHVREYFEEYSWSTYGGTMDELSAAQALYFITSDVQRIAVFPGGNSAITNALASRLERALPVGSLRPTSLVVRVAPHPDGVAVTYERRDGVLDTILARACIVACPKFVAKKIVAELPAEQLAAMSRLRYRAYLVANAIVRRRVTSEDYDCFRLVGQLPATAKEALAHRAYTDLIFGAWAAHDRPDVSALTLYKALAYEGGRAEVFADGSFERVKREFEAAVPELAGIVGVRPDDVEAVRVTRFGHPLPLAEKGLLSDGIAPRAHAPIGGRIFFAQQDNWCSPAFEPAFASARETVALVRRALGG